MMLAIIPICIVLAILFGLKRSFKADIVHLVLVVVSVLAAVLLKGSLSTTAEKIISEKMTEFSGFDPFLQKLIIGCTGPALFTVTALLILLVLSLIALLIFKGKGEKGSSASKIAVNAVSGLLVAIIVLVPFAFYPQLSEKVSSYEKILNLELPEEVLSVIHKTEKFGVSLPVPSLLSNFDYDGESFTVSETFDGIKKLDEMYINPLPQIDVEYEVAEIKKDTHLDILMGHVSRVCHEAIPDTMLSEALALEGKFSDKVRAILSVSRLLSVLSGKENAKEQLRLLIEEADEQLYQTLAGLCTFDRLKMTHLFTGQNAPLIKSIILEMPLLEDKSPESINRELEALAYMMIPHSKTSPSFDYNHLPVKEVARCISESTILQKAYIRVTENGELINPCDMYLRVYDSNLSNIIFTLDKTYGFHPDSLLYKCMLYYFGVKEI